MKVFRFFSLALLVLLIAMALVVGGRSAAFSDATRPGRSLGPGLGTATGIEQAAQGGLTHYIVFETGQDGVIRPLYHRLVQLAAPLVSLTPGEMAARLSLPDRNSELLAVRLEADAGGVAYQNVAEIPRWLRGEFHGAGPDAVIDGHVLPLERKTFVVRVPVIGGAQLHLEDSSGAEARFDPAALAADNTLPLTGSEPEVAVSSGPLAGNPANRVDLLIMGDGYRAAESGKFAADAATTANGFFSISPYAEYANYVNVHTLFTASSQSGADHPPYSASCSAGDPTCCGDPEMQSDPLAGTFVNTAFGATYCTWNIHRLLTVDTSAVLAAAAAVPDWDEILVIVNDPTYGGSGGGISVISMHTYAVDIAQHEYGHAFTLLADEYESPYPGFPVCSDISGPPCEVNVTDRTTRALIKWAPWILAQTPVPTPEDTPLYAGAVGLFEGARYRTTGIYRSGDSCLMRSLGAPFCQVPSQAYVLRLYDGGWGVPAAGIDTIEPGSENPPPGSVSAPLPGSLTLSVALLQPVGGPPLEVKWYVNGVVDPGAHSSSYTFVPSGRGSFQIRLEVADSTPLVHPAMAGSSLQNSRVWNVTVEDGDDDGFSDAREVYLGTDPLDACPDNSSDDAWPLDVDSSRDISVTGDIINYRGRLGSRPGDPNWWQRLDLDQSGDISVTGDVFKFRGKLGLTCT